jgi:hypothetical protein
MLCFSLLHTYIQLTRYPRKVCRDMSDNPLGHPYFTKMTMRNTADVTGGNGLQVYVTAVNYILLLHVPILSMIRITLS